ncbi:MAG: DUF2460 domain-containing protein [Acidobacteriota bacterium]
MAVFPTLKSGAVAQYPAERSRRFATVVCEFVGGGEQRFPQFKRALKRWEIRLELLDEEELFHLETFLVEQAGATGSFSFADPWDDTVYLDCSFEGDQMGLEFAGNGNGKASVIVRENL